MFINYALCFLFDIVLICVRLSFSGYRCSPC